MSLAPKIRSGLLNLPGQSPRSRFLLEHLLEEDRAKNHCFFNSLGFHNHLSHHLLAAYDLGASDELLEAINAEESKEQRPLLVANPNSPPLVVVTERNWCQFLGRQEYYASYLSLFLSYLNTHGTTKTLEEFVFSAAANTKDSCMLPRFVAGAYHPLIQAGYGAEFGSNGLIAQGLAMTAISSPMGSIELYDTSLSFNVGERYPTDKSLFALLRFVYDSPVLKPVLPYDPDALISARIRKALTLIRVYEIRRLSNFWVSGPQSKEDIDRRIEELFWLSTQLLVGTSKCDHKPRLDFFLMHVLNATLFLPSLFNLIPLNLQYRLLNSLMPTVILFIIIRGRPRIDPDLVMGYTDHPSPPTAVARASSDAIRPDASNPWPTIISSVIHSPDAHTVKAIRTLYYAAQRYGSTPAGSVPGAFALVRKDENGQEKGTFEETHEGIGNVDGTVFLRAAGVVMDTLGWVTHGQKAGGWDRSGLGWDDAWK